MKNSNAVSKSTSKKVSTSKKAEKVVKTESTEKVEKVERFKAKFPGVYSSPTKKNPGRFIANYRSNLKTIKIGFYNSEEEAIEAKKTILESIKE